jgi:hypothetical protein
LGEVPKKQHKKGGRQFAGKGKQVSKSKRQFFNLYNKNGKFNQV